MLDHHYFMQLALQQAKLAAAAGEVPVGAVLVKNNEVIAAGYNQPIIAHDPSAHAEIIVLREAAKKLNNYRLVGTCLYVTLEPCTMCVGALIHARVEQLIFGAAEPKAGAVISKTKLLDENHFNHKINYLGGVLEEECGKVLSEFFKARRAGVWRQ